MQKHLVVITICLSFSLPWATSMDDYDKRMHPHMNNNVDRSNRVNEVVEDAQFWIDSAAASLSKRLSIKHIENKAKNVVFFLGDGMSVPTVTAARILKGQKVDLSDFGEEAELHMDSFTNIGVSKTFCSDSQVADSACSATAYLCGSKGNIGTIGVTPTVQGDNCTAQGDKANHVNSIIAWAQAEGKSTGVVTTTRITHASPAGTYAHIANRNWENDDEVKKSGGDPAVCPDIAAQLILGETGKNITVIMGGGRLNFLPETELDPESKKAGYRRDNQNLIQAWVDTKRDGNSSYVTTRDELEKLNISAVDHLLGLFAPSHLAYLDEQEKDNDPSLEKMTQVAISILKKNPNGFVLFVEGGRIDHAHHDNFAQRALWETIEFDKAIKQADDLTDDEDTLIVVTADHAHVMSISGYPTRGNPLMGIANIADDGLPYATLGYMNGPGHKPLVNNTRTDITNDDFENITYQQPAPIPINSETHGGDDVLIFSKGPFSHLLTGVQQQSYIPHVIRYAACMGTTGFCTVSSESTTNQTTVPVTSTVETSSTTVSAKDEGSGASVPILAPLLISFFFVSLASVCNY